MEFKVILNKYQNFNSLMIILKNNDDYERFSNINSVKNKSIYIKDNKNKIIEFELLNIIYSEINLIKDIYITNEGELLKSDKGNSNYFLLKNDMFKK